jgi:hypothetical protein
MSARPAPQPISSTASGRRVSSMPSSVAWRLDAPLKSFLLIDSRLLVFAMSIQNFPNRVERRPGRQRITDGERSLCQPQHAIDLFRGSRACA